MTFQSHNFPTHKLSLTVTCNDDNSIQTRKYKEPITNMNRNFRNDIVTNEVSLYSKRHKVGMPTS